MLAVLASIAVPAAAQSTSTGTLTGLVKDAAGGVLPGVTVTATQPRRRRELGTIVTGSQGEWTLTTLARRATTPLTFELAAFKRQVRPNVVVEAGVPRSVNVTLEIGAISESITVQGGVELLTPTTATAFRRLSAEELTLVPTTTRSFTHLLVVGSRRQRRAAAGAGEWHGQHLAIGQRHAHDEHEPVLQRHRRNESHLE